MDECYGNHALLPSSKLINQKTHFFHDACSSRNPSMWKSEDWEISVPLKSDGEKYKDLLQNISNKTSTGF